MIRKNAVTRRVLSGAALSVILACGTMILSAADVRAQSAPEPRAVLTLEEKGVIAVDASALNVQVTDTTPHEYPQVGYLSPLTYDQAVRAWSILRFAPNGGSVNTFRVTLRQGSITEKLLPVTKGISGWFKKEQGAEYQGTLDVEVAIVGPNGDVLATADAKCWASESVGENATQADKEKAWMNVTKSTFDNLDRELLPRVRKTMATYLR